MTIQISLQKHLYVVAIRKTTSEPRRALSAGERLRGWRDGEDYSGNLLVINEGHERGSLHSCTGPHVLAWEVHPGEQVIVRLDVEFAANVSPDGTFKYVGAECRPTVWTPDGQPLLAEIATVLGRAVALGEDGAEDAFDNDALTDQLQQAVFEGDWRRSQCECRLHDVDADDFGALQKKLTARAVSSEYVSPYSEVE